MKKCRVEFIFGSKWLVCSLQQKSCHFGNTVVYLPMVNFLQEKKEIHQEEKEIHSVAVETFCDSITPQICEPPQVSIWHAGGGVSLDM